MSAAAEESPADQKPLLFRKFELYPQRIHYNGITASLGDFPIEILNPSITEPSRAVSGGSVHALKANVSAQERRSVAREFYEHGFDHELSFRISFQKIGAGLENLGNTCYLNSVLQCLTYTEPFAAYLQSGKHKSTCRNAGFCAMCALQNHVLDARQSTGKILRPFHLVKNLRCISRSFRNYRQEDAHEYMVNLLESMHKCCLPYGVQSESSSAYEKSQVHKIFGGQLRSQVKCEQCSYCSNKFDPFLDLSLEIVKADSLRKALEHFTALELLDNGERQYQCHGCNEKVRAFKQLTVHKAPHVLTIHLKRFGSTIHGEKLSKKVEYELTLDLNPFISDPHEESYKYTLYGVLVHAGWSTHSGHYFCYVRTSFGTWYSLDDNEVTQVSEKTVLSREAYMLFYVRDRTLKRSDLISSAKPDISGSADRNKVISMMESKSNAAVYSSVENINDGTSNEFVPARGTSLQKIVKIEGLLWHVKDRVETKYYHMEIDGAVFTSKLETSSKDPEKFLPSIDSKLPSDGDQKSNTTHSALAHCSEAFHPPHQGDIQDSALAHCLKTFDPPHRDDIEKAMECSNLMNDSIQKEAVARMVNNRNNGHEDHEVLNCPINPQLQKGADSFLKSMEVNSLLPKAAICGVQQDTTADAITEKLIYTFHQTESKLKKPRKISLGKGPYLRHKQLFFMSSHLPKKKHLRRKKRRRISRSKINMRIFDSNTDSHEASTSETFQAIDVTSRHTSSRHSHSTSKKSKGDGCVKIGKNFVHNKDWHTSMNSATHDTSSKSSRLCFTEEETSVKRKSTEDADILNFSVNSLKTTLKEKPVAMWVDKNVQAEQTNEMKESSIRNVGYILDEWDEDYDRGKRKKAKKSRQWFGFGVHNPFQALAGFRPQQKAKLMVERRSSGNRPFRI